MIIPMTPLCELAKLYRTDKGGQHDRYGETYSDTCHAYTPVYDRLLGTRRNAVQAVLEIGVNAGGSLRMWRDYFPNAQIVGLDWHAPTLYTEDRIRCFLADQREPRTLIDAVKESGITQFDLIVDDASHEFLHQVHSMQVLLPYLSRYGLYVIEDLHDDCHPELVGKYVPPRFYWKALPCPEGIGRAHCWCDECKDSVAKGNGFYNHEQLLIVQRG